MQVSKQPGPEKRSLILAGILLTGLLFWTMVAWFGVTESWLVGVPFTPDSKPLLATLPFLVVAVVVAWQVIEMGRRQARVEATMRESHLQALQNAYNGLLQTTTAMVDLRDSETGGHSMRVQHYAWCIGQRMQISPAELRTLIWGSRLHDIGKVGIPDYILRKPDSLTAVEWAVMRQHVVLGSQILRGTVLESWSYDVIRYHHERVDGTGYPDGLRGEEIPLVARIFAVADAFDAMTSNRPYRKPLTTQAARLEIERNAGKQFCPRVVVVFRSISDEELQAGVQRGDELIQLDADQGTLLVVDRMAKSNHTYYEDRLTGTWNRNALEEGLSGTGDSSVSVPAAVVFVDVDQLKRVNDLHGHLVGDQVLVDLARRLLSLCAQVCRYGGDEFVLFFKQGEWSAARRKALTQTMADFHSHWVHLGVGVGASFGCAVAGADGCSSRELIQHADAAMYVDKERKRLVIRKAGVNA